VTARLAGKTGFRPHEDTPQEEGNLRLIVKDGGGEWKIGVLRKDLNPREFALTFLGTSKVERGSSVGKFQQIQQSLFRGESSGFVNLPLSQHVNTLTSPHYSWRFVAKLRSRIARPAPEPA